jgi:hypothetical protein
LPLGLLLIGYITYLFVKGSKNKPVTAMKGALVMLVFSLVYSMIQPSYIPKTEVKALPKVPEALVKDIPVENRLLSPMQKEERQERVEALLTNKDEVKDILNKTKENK